jgi:hypothetical protein
MAQTKAEKIDELTVLVRRAVKRLDADAVAALVAHPTAVEVALAATASTVGIERSNASELEPIGGPEPVLVSRSKAGRRLAARTKAQSERGLLSSDELATRAGLKTRQSVHDRLRKGRVIGWEGARRGYVFPAGQLDERGRPLVGIGRIAAMFPDGYAAWAWLNTPLAALDGASPLSLLKQGKVEAVITAAQGDAQGDFG